MLSMQSLLAHKANIHERLYGLGVRPVRATVRLHPYLYPGITLNPRFFYTSYIYPYPLPTPFTHTLDRYTCSHKGLG